MVLRLRQESPDNRWSNVKCSTILVDKDNDPFFSEDESEIAEAIDFCNGISDGVVCPVRHQCLIFSLVNNCKEGVWGGTSEATRKAIRKRYPPLKGNLPREEWQWQSSEKDALKPPDLDQKNQEQAGEE